jgi:hypothetical protein
MWSRILKSEKGFDRVTSIQKLEQWYAKQCDGTWEHQRGIVIDTLDNPGWSVTIDLDGTDLEGIQMEPISSDNGEHDWHYCKIEGGKFIGHGDSLKLEVILEVFVGIIPRDEATNSVETLDRARKISDQIGEL